jgi:SAM-dependent methyltransferase
MDKLKGQAYLEHWEKRMARGPHEAGTEENADAVWAFVKPHLADFTPRSVLEQGCAYGRMLRRIRNQWPKAKLYGVDISKDALTHLEANWVSRPPTLFNQSAPPLDIKVDMIWTCTVLQHVTDDQVLGEIVEGFRAILNPKGKLVLFENVTWAHGGGGAHMRHFGAADYMGLWPELRWQDCGTFMHGAESHELMIGTNGLDLRP